MACVGAGLQPLQALAVATLAAISGASLPGTFRPIEVDGSMRELMQSTRRIRRGWLDRIRGYKRLFETEIIDGEHSAYEKGGNSEASKKSGNQPPSVVRRLPRGA